MQNEKEIWKSVDEVPKFEFSNLGNIRRKIEYNNGTSGYRYMKKAKPGSRKKIVIRDKNYSNGMRGDLAEVYFLKAFSIYDPNKRIVHKDGDLTNNILDNLTQLTSKQLTSSVKEKTLLRNPGFKIIKCNEQTQKKLKEYTYYTDAVRDVLHEQGYTDDEITLTLKNRTLRRIRYAVIQKRVPTACGYWWIRKDE